MTISLRYPNFKITAPLFLRAQDEAEFKNYSDNSQLLGWQSENRLRGEIQWFRGGLANHQQECSWNTKQDEAKTRASCEHDVLVAVPRSCPILYMEGGSFQHFVDGNMPKILQVLPLLTRAHHPYTLVTPRIKNRIVREMLEEMGVFHVFTYRPKTCIVSTEKVNTCITPPLHPYFFQLARTIFRISEQRTSNLTDVVIFVRKSRRRIQNEHEVLESLRARFGSHLKVLQHTDGLGLQDMITLLKNTKILIGVHGGALYNLLFCPANATVIEILPVLPNGAPIPHISSRIFWAMSVMLGQTYWRLHQEVVNRRHDLNVDIDALHDILNKHKL